MLKPLKFFLESPELASTLVNAGLEAGYICCQLQAWGKDRECHHGIML
jgi:hypothetical protein